MRGILLAGGKGTRLYPASIACSKQILPLYNKPLVYYSLSTLMLAKIRKLLLISDRENINYFRKLLKDGSQFGVSIQYKIQEEPRGIADAFKVGRKFIENDPVCLILCDNFFYAYDFFSILKKGKEYVQNDNKATIFGYNVSNPEKYGVLKLRKGNRRILDIIEKPKNPPSNWIATGLYMFPSDVVFKTYQLNVSSRGELEITDLIKLYLEEKRLEMVELSRGVAWSDCGEFDSLLDTANYVRSIETRQGLMVCSPDEIAYRMGYIDDKQMEINIENCGDNTYRDCLIKVLHEGVSDASD